MHIYKKLDKSTLKQFHKYKLLESLIKAELIEGKTNNITIEPEKLKEIINASKNSYQIKNDEEYVAFLKSKNISQDEWEYQISIPYKIETYCLHKFSSKAESRFLQRKNELDQITYTIVRVNVKDFSLARELYLRITEDNESMNEIAKIYSTGPEKRTNGSVGPIDASKIHPKLSALLRGCSPGEVKEPILIQDFWMIVRLDSYYDAKLDDKMKSRMSLESFLEDLSQTIAKEVKELLNPNVSN
tara:strand:+ start:344 stop:1075 length:732 start_codon:yes stop_codon:yes gene_type:complete